MFVPLSSEEIKEFQQGIPCIIVPFRDNVEQNRMKQLNRFISHIQRYHPDWTVIVVEQSDDGKKFNRGALLNIGAHFAEKSNHSYVIFHDVDLLPLMKIVPYYTAFPTHPIHIGKIWTQKYDFPKFLGGVLSMSLADIRKINGFPNNFWGWGGEDDSIRNRMIRKNIPIYQPTLRGEGFTELSHIDSKSKNEWKNMTKWEDLKEDTGRNGFRNTKYDVIKIEKYNNTMYKVSVLLK